MAVAQISVRQPDDITVCPLCEQLLTDPDVLPCFHVYCSSCLEDWYRDKGHVGDRGHCPQCNTSYVSFPRESVEVLNNRFVIKLLDLKRILGSEEVLCVLCLSEKIRENGTALQRAATTYCIDCRQNYCDHCIATHEIINPLVSHRIVERGTSRPIKELLLSSSFDRCDMHVDKQLEVYCKICRKAMCLLCSVETPHQTHDRIQVDTVLESLRSGIAKDINSISTGISACQTVRGNLLKIADDFSQHIGQVSSVVEINYNKKLSCRRETAMVLLVIEYFFKVTQGHSRSLKMVPFERLGTVSYSHSIPIAPTLYHFRDKARYWSKIAIFIPSCIRRPRQRVTVGILPCRFVRKKN